MSTPEKIPFLARLAHRMVRRRRWVIAVWIGLTLFGAYAAGQVSNRWFESFSIPGYSAYEANQRTLHAFGTGAQAPLVLGVPLERRHHEGDRHQEGDRRRGDGQRGLTRGVVLVDRQSRLRLEGRAHGIRDRSTRPARRRSARRCTSIRCARR